MLDFSAQLIHAIKVHQEGKDQEAEALFQECLKLDPDNAGAIYSLSVILLKRREHQAALQLLNRGVAAAPGFAPLWFARGAALQGLGQNEDALHDYDQALLIQPAYVEVLINSGALLREMHRHSEALQRFNRVLEIDPNHENALGNCGILLTEFKQSEEAIKMFRRLLEINPSYDYGLGLLCYEQLHACDWTRVDEMTAQIRQGIQQGKRACKSLAFMAISDSAEDHQTAARIFSRHFFADSHAPLCAGVRYRHERIRIAYISPDLREHPVGHLIAGVLEQHDKRRFEVTAISLGIDDQSRLRARMLKAFDRFIDARGMSSRQIAGVVRELEIDVLIDLAGYTSDSRTEVFTYRPAPVQVNFLGYPGTLGLSSMDYILADRYVIPPEQQRFYDERVVYLPDCYLPTDASIMISERTPSREECGLPESGLVLCAFSHDYKISPHIFDIWMRVMCRIPDSTLWLVSRSEVSQRNLRQAAEDRGVASQRIVFAGRVPRVEDHLARYRVADLFLDTHPYNAHTTAADALLAGLPVVTYMGNAFPARVAGSLLHSIGLPELITYSLADYESLILSLGCAPARIAQLKKTLLENKSKRALFNTPDFCRNLEAAYISMWRTAQLGEARDALSPNPAD
jgi:protein O-GlcNAc transferase